MKHSFEDISNAVLKNGWAQIPGFYTSEKCTNLWTECESMEGRHYCSENLLSHSVYPSDVSETRISHAMMVSEGASRFPKVSFDGLTEIKDFVQVYHAFLEILTGVVVSEGSRSLLNWQSYNDGSTKVPLHFDGEYLKTNRNSDREFELLEGIVPRYVCILTVFNENVVSPYGVEFVDERGETIGQPKCRAGDLILFDNIRLRHLVPTLKHNRRMVGLRNFDHLPLHYVKDRSQQLLGATYQACHGGWVSKEVDCGLRMQQFLKEEWPKIRETYGAYV